MKSLVTSFLVSGILFIIVFSVVTNEFPPKISRIKAGVENMQKLMQLTQTALGAQLQKQSATAGPGATQQQGPDSIDLSNDDTMVDNMQKIGKKRQSLGQKIFGGMGEEIESAPARSQTSSDIQTQMLAMHVEMAELKSLIKQVKLQQAEIKEVLISRSHGSTAR